jgi:hypothetical protein
MRVLSDDPSGHNYDIPNGSEYAISFNEYGLSVVRDEKTNN